MSSREMVGSSCRIMSSGVVDCIDRWRERDVCNVCDCESDA